MQSSLMLTLSASYAAPPTSPCSVSKLAMPLALSQSIRRFTSAITSGPMPSPGRSRSLWVAIVVSSQNLRGVLERRARLGKQGWPLLHDLQDTFAASVVAWAAADPHKEGLP